MKRWGFILVNIFFIAALLSLPSVKSKASAGKSMSFKGKVIFLNNEFMEVKFGKREMQLYFTESTKFLNKNWKPLDKSGLEICQLVRAYYSMKDNKRTISKVVVLKEGYCNR